MIRREFVRRRDANAASDFPFCDGSGRIQRRRAAAVFRLSRLNAQSKGEEIMHHQGNGNRLKRIFGGLKWSWPGLILFAVISGVVTGLIALLVPDGNSFRQIAVTFEAWIVLAVIVAVNCEKPLEAACKTFVYFLISQPLVYLVQVPFHSMGFGLFRYYWPYWFYWTAAVFPGAFIAWYVKRDDWIAALILSVALAMLILIGSGYLKELISAPPKFLVAALFCFGSVPLLILCILHKRNPRLIAAGIAVLVLVVCMFVQFRSGVGKDYEFSFGLDPEKYPVTEGWRAELEDPDNGTVILTPGEDVIGPGCHVVIRDISKPTGIILTDPDGSKYTVPLVVEQTENGLSVSY